MIELLLRAAGAQQLPKVAFLVQKPDPYDGNIEIARRLEEISGKNPQSACIERKSSAQTELHAEISNAAKSGCVYPAAKPATRLKILFPRGHEFGQLPQKFPIASELFEPLS
jgi:hypothetical protein